MLRCKYQRARSAGEQNIRVNMGKFYFDATPMENKSGVFLRAARTTVHRTAAGSFAKAGSTKCLNLSYGQYQKPEA